MSTDWNVACLDCQSVDRYCDANHCEKLMRDIAKNSSAIAGLGALMESADRDGLELRTPYGCVDIYWHVLHHTHRLAIISEYGDLETLDGKSLGRADWAWGA